MKRMKRKTVWAYLDGKKLVDVVKAALDNNMMVDDNGKLLLRLLTTGILGVGIYFVILKAFLFVLDISMASYSGADTVGIGNILRNLPGSVTCAYQDFFAFFAGKDIMVNSYWICPCYGVIFVAFLCLLIRKMVKNQVDMLRGGINRRRNYVSRIGTGCFLPNDSVQISCIGKRNLRIIRFVNGTKKPQEEREMKATGIVRRIDDLGRVVIPKEIRRTMRIREGDPLEIYTDKDGEVIFKKYSLMGGLSDFATQMCETLNKTTGHVCVITDRDSCIAVAGAPRRDLMDKRLGERLEAVLEGRKIYQFQAGETPMPVSDETGKFFVACAAPIMAEGDVLGCVLFADEEGDLGASGGDTEYKLLQSMSGFLGRHMEG